MNLLKHTIIAIDGEPYFRKIWWVDVVVVCEGNIFTTTTHAQTEEEARAIKVGDEFYG